MGWIYSEAAPYGCIISDYYSKQLATLSKQQCSIIKALFERPHFTSLQKALFSQDLVCTQQSCEKKAFIWAFLAKLLVKLAGARFGTFC